MLINKKIIILLIGALLLLSPSDCNALSSKQNKKLTILLSNDDGYNAPGIKALAETLSNKAYVFVSAPEVQQSGAGHGITYREPIFVKKITRKDSIPWYSVSAKPATCVRIGIQELLKTKPDLVISGINSEPNLGLTAYYSGTLGAAREAAIIGLPAIAVSAKAKNNKVYSEGAAYIDTVIKKLEEKELIKPGLFLSINIPENIADGMPETKITKLSQKSLIRNFEKRKSPNGKTYYWNSYEIENDNLEGTDINAFNKGYITITPFTLDITKSNDLEKFKLLEHNNNTKISNH